VTELGTYETPTNVLFYSFSSYIAETRMSHEKGSANKTWNSAFVGVIQVSKSIGPSALRFKPGLMALLIDNKLHRS
jgi:hypothetical protein